MDSKLEAAQQQSAAAATAAPTTRSLRSRARSATAAAAEPRTTRSTRSRQAVPAAAPEPEPMAPAAAAAAEDISAPAQAQLQTLMAVDSPARPAAAAAAQAPAAAAAKAPGAAGQPAADAEARRAAAQAKVDAKLAALGLAAAGTAARGADRTVLRQPKPGETFFSKNGEWAVTHVKRVLACGHIDHCCLLLLPFCSPMNKSVVQAVARMQLHAATCEPAAHKSDNVPQQQFQPQPARPWAASLTRCAMHAVKLFQTCAGSPLSIHPNVTRHRGRTVAASLMTPAMQAAAPAGSSMLGCITLIKKQGAATGAAAATGRSKRSRAAVAAVAEEEGTGADGGTAMMVTTDGKRVSRA